MLCPRCGNELIEDSTKPDKVVCMACKKRMNPDKVEEYWGKQVDKAFDKMIVPEQPATVSDSASGQAIPKSQKSSYMSTRDKVIAIIGAILVAFAAWSTYHMVSTGSFPWVENHETIKTVTQDDELTNDYTNVDEHESGSLLEQLEEATGADLRSNSPGFMGITGWTNEHRQ